MEIRRLWPLPFTSALSRRAAILVLLWLPVHTVALRLVLTRLMLGGALTQAEATLFYYLSGCLYLVPAAFRFLRRDFDPLVEHPFLCLREMLGGYCGMYCCNYAMALLMLALFPQAQNPNDLGIAEIARQEQPVIRAALVFLAPMVEELLFRAGVFGLLRRKSRLAAYAVSTLCFAVYHIAPYAVQDPFCWIFLLEYVPASLLLARCYERSNSIWCSIFFHMFNNGVAFAAISALS